MRSRIIVTVMALAVVLAFSSVALAQAPGGARDARNAGQAQTDHVALPSIPAPPGWGNCPRCENNDDRAKAWKDNKADGHAFNAKDLSGVWGWGLGNTTDDAFELKSIPPLTDYGKKMQAATMADPGKPAHSKDTSGRGSGSPINCDPYSWPRLYTYNYGFEFVMLPNRVLQFFELNHTWRTIWTDGRKLPAEPPEPHWLGWSVGHWEGDTFVIESSGYDERSWINSKNPDGGWPHSDEMKIVERYRRINYGTMEAELTIIDPKVYTKPWVTPKGQIKLNPGTELWETFCAPSDYQQFNEKVFEPAAEATKK
jgi:hypothetical protein